MQKVNEWKKLYNEYKDKILLLEKSKERYEEYGILYLYLCTDYVKRMNHREEQADYYAKKIRDYYKEHTLGTLHNGNF